LKSRPDTEFGQHNPVPALIEFLKSFRCCSEHPGTKIVRQQHRSGPSPTAMTGKASRRAGAYLYLRAGRTTWSIAQLRPRTRGKWCRKIAAATDRHGHIASSTRGRQNRQPRAYQHTHGLKKHTQRMSDSSRRVRAESSWVECTTPHLSPPHDLTRPIIDASAASSDRPAIGHRSEIKATTPSGSSKTPAHLRAEFHEQITTREGESALRSARGKHSPERNSSKDRLREKAREAQHTQL
jgi:hypothetical protein